MIVLNEIDYAEQCLELGLVDKKPFFTLGILAKYYYHHLNKTKEETEKLVIEYADKYCSGYWQNEKRWDEGIKKMVSKIDSKILYMVESVPITKSEFEVIHRLNDEQLECLAFTLLCVGKLNMIKHKSNEAWVNSDLREIFTLAHVSCKSRERNSRIRKLLNEELIEMTSKIDDLSMKVLFVDSTSDVLFEVSDFRDLGYEYLNMLGGNFIRCEKCGVIIKNNAAGTKKYCSSCSQYTPLIYRQFECVDCGSPTKVKSTDRRSVRCDECKPKYYKERKHLEYVRRKEKFT